MGNIFKKLYWKLPSRISKNFKSKKKLKAQWAEPVLLTFHFVLRKLYTEPSIDASYQISVHLATWFQRRRFYRNNQKQELLMVAMFVNGSGQMSILYIGPSIDASYQVLIILPSGLRGEDIFRNQPIRNMNCLWRPCLLTDRGEMCILYKEPSIDDSYKGLVHLAKRFQRRRI